MDFTGILQESGMGIWKRAQQSISTKTNRQNHSLRDIVFFTHHRQTYPFKSLCSANEGINHKNAKSQNA
jgi:hypothetical protein